MKRERYLSEEELIRKAVGVLIRELGPVETARFINLRPSRRVESVKRHRQWQKNLDTNRFLEEIFGK